jgi:hypothetical protein
MFRTVLMSFDGSPCTAIKICEQSLSQPAYFISILNTSALIEVADKITCRALKMFCETSIIVI